MTKLFSILGDWSIILRQQAKILSDAVLPDNDLELAQFNAVVNQIDKNGPGGS
ncbi:MAG TPA: hypothetical protein VFR94_10065 [Nitrososphaeraceae archaeon]|nr:hypothetical protein [Nitrososphaeraceae archaeon]